MVLLSTCEACVFSVESQQLPFLRTTQRVLCTLQVSAVHMSLLVQCCINFTPPARTSADKTSAHSWSYFAGTTFQMFLATLPQDFVAP